MFEAKDSVDWSGIRNALFMLPESARRADGSRGRRSTPDRKRRRAALRALPYIHQCAKK
jgi:hypothetical protein